MKQTNINTAEDKIKASGSTYSVKRNLQSANNIFILETLIGYIYGFFLASGWQLTVISPDHRVSAKVSLSYICNIKISKALPFKNCLQINSNTDEAFMLFVRKLLRSWY